MAERQADSLQTRETSCYRPVWSRSKEEPQCSAENLECLSVGLEKALALPPALPAASWGQGRA